MFLALTLACVTDFSLEPIAAKNLGDDTGAPLTEDTGWDTAPADTEPPTSEREEEDLDLEKEEEIPPAPFDDCTETSDLVYLIDRGGERLWLFDPDTLSFEVLGALDCDTWSATPGSMGVSRSGEAFVRYSDESLHVVSLDDLSCEQADFQAPGSFGSFGMGYATDDADTWVDALYVADSSRLGRLDADGWSLDVLGPMPSQSELTGNSAGELWAFLPLESPARLSQRDKETGAEVSRINLSGFPSVRDIDTFAFAYWGDAFWVFVRTYGMGSSTDVYRVGASGRMEMVLEDIGFDVVGAGVSTCAPSE